MRRSARWQLARRRVPLASLRALAGLTALAILLAACAPGQGGGGGGGSGATGRIVGHALAGPVCPVQSVSPDPACADRPVPDATIVVSTPDGREVARTRTDGAGGFTVEVPAGSYGLTGEPVEGLMGNPSTPVAVTVVAGATTADVLLQYDTGIR